MTSLWRKQLRPGSFRGVAFQVDSHDFEGGRRIVDHLFPYKDEPYTEDLGRKQRIYRVNAYVVGSDYFPQRDDLLEALERGGPGILVHPYLGTKTVEAGDFSVSEAIGEGGLAKITITFRETSKVVNPTGVLDRLSDAKDKANAVEIALTRAFASFNSPSPNSFVFASAASMVNSVSSVLSAATSAIPSRSANGISDLTYSIRNLKGNSRSLILRPGELGTTIINAMKDLRGALNIEGLLPEDTNGRVILPGNTSSDDDLKRRSFLPILDFPALLPVTYDTTDSRIQEKKNQDLMRQLVLGSAIAELLVVSTGTSYGTFDDAVGQRDKIVSEIDKLLNDPTIGDDVYSALQDLSAATVRNIPDPSSEAPRISKITINDGLPSLVVAYDLYGNLSLETDIIIRNRIPNPAFITPLYQLEVIAGD